MGFTLDSIMSLRDEVKQILNDFDNTSSDKILEILTQIQSHLKSDITQNYLQGKIQAILGINDNTEKKKLCKNLKPYLDWYLQGT
jgi:DNA-binding protein Fis